LLLVGAKVRRSELQVDDVRGAWPEILDGELRGVADQVEADAKLIAAFRFLS
jgi:hypothetical protein